jgi:hypothetical protein
VKTIEGICSSTNIDKKLILLLIRGDSFGISTSIINSDIDGIGALGKRREGRYNCLEIAEVLRDGVTGLNSKDVRRERERDENR